MDYVENRKKIRRNRIWITLNSELQILICNKTIKIRSRAQYMPFDKSSFKLADTYLRRVFTRLVCIREQNTAAACLQD